MKILKIMGKIVLTLISAYFLFFVLLISIFIVLIGINPPSSEFSGLYLVILFYPFFYLGEVIGFFGLIIIFVPLFFLNVYFTLRLVFNLQKSTSLKILGVIIFVPVGMFLFAQCNPANKLTSLEDVNELGVKSARINDVSQCDKRIASKHLSSRENCYRVAAVFSGNKDFCDLTRDADYCYDDVDTADNLYKKFCPAITREECFKKHCFYDDYADSIDYDLSSCVTRKAKELLDAAYCDLIAGETNAQHFERCLERAPG